MAKSGVIYGPTGTWKTTAIAHMSRYIARKVGKRTLLLSADGGGWTPCDEEITAGLIKPFRVDPITIPLPMIRKASQGYWPRNPEEPDVSKVDFVPIDWNEIGAIAIEGITSLGTMLMRHVADKAIKTGEEATSKFAQPIRVEGQIVSEMFAGNSKAHYQFVQNQLYGMVMNFISLPVEYILFTGHEKRAEDDDRTTIYGVAAPGKAITPLIPTWLGDCIHAQDYQIKQAIKVPVPGVSKPVAQCKPEELIDAEVVNTHVRYYIKKHPDPVTGIMFPAKPRVTHGAVRALEEAYPLGYFEPTPDYGFDRYLETLDRLAIEYAQRDDLKQWREKIDAKLGRGPKPIETAKDLDVERPKPVPVAAGASK